MSKKNSAFLLTLFVVLLSSSFVSADAVKDAAKKVADVVFSEAERQIIEKYYERRKPAGENKQKSDEAADNDKKIKGKDKKAGKDRGKGKNKEKAMPKGIAMKLERGGAMPPGIAKTRLPGELEKQLPPPPKGFERIESEGKVILADVVTGVITDIIKIGGKRKTTETQEKMSMEKTDVRETRKNTTQDKETTETIDKPEKKWWQIWKD